jgi:hypothetical protein
MGVLSDFAGGGGAINAGMKIIKKVRDSRKKKDAPVSGSGSGDAMPMDSYHSGGKVRKTGPARLKKGERVLTKGQYSKLRKRARSKSR